MDVVATKLTDFFTKGKKLSDDQREIYSYGFKLLLADIINFTIVLVISLLIDKFMVGMFFLITLCSVRKYSGGFHAKTFWLCRLSLIVTYIVVVVILSQILNVQNLFMLNLCINIFAIILIAILSPVEHKNKPLSSKQHRINKFKASIWTIIFSSISLLLFNINKTISMTISLTLVAIVILMFIGIFEQKGAEKNV